LVHQAGLRSWIPFYKETLPEKGKLNEMYAEKRSDEFSVEVAEGVYMRKAFVDTIWQRVLDSEVVENPKYNYSDLGYYFFKELAEAQLKLPMEKFLHSHFYAQLGMNNTTYKARNYFPEERIVPSEKDEYFRLQTLQGHVHDMGAAMLGGIGGHAGLFSNANDLAKMMQLYLNGGNYGSQTFFDRATINLFTQKQIEDNRRGLGFDKPELNTDKTSPCAECVSPKTFGHSGFTGTCVWADPAHNLIYVFLSNRVYPTMNNRKLVKENIRTEIQDAIYEAILGEQLETTSLEN
jgi:CubicO group peptidase (beta-lactamase class C family)